MIRKLLQWGRLYGKSFARALRKEMTPEETRLWKALRARQFQRLKFRRQVPIGKYVVDFLCVAHHLIIEVDGPIHEAHREYDESRNTGLRERGYRILRFSNDEITNHLPLVLQHIEQAIFPSTTTKQIHPPSPNTRNTKRKDVTQHSCSEAGEGVRG